MSARTVMPTREQPGPADSKRMPMAWLAASRWNKDWAHSLASVIASWLVMEVSPFGNPTAQQQRRPVAFFAITGLQVFQRLKNVRQANGIGPGQRPLWICLLYTSPSPRD